jgi:hypothetical protein
MAEGFGRFRFVRANRAILESGHLSGFRRCLERFQGIPYFLDLSPDQTAILWRIRCGQHDPGGSATSIFDPGQRVKKGGIQFRHCRQM